MYIASSRLTSFRSGEKRFKAETKCFICKFTNNTTNNYL